MSDCSLYHSVEIYDLDSIFSNFRLSLKIFYVYLDFFLTNFYHSNFDYHSNPYVSDMDELT